MLVQFSLRRNNRRYRHDHQRLDLSRGAVRAWWDFWLSQRCYYLQHFVSVRGLIMAKAVRIHCGGVRDSFLLSTGVRQPNGDIEPGPVQVFETEQDATEAGERSACVRAMGWDFTVEDYP